MRKKELQEQLFRSLILGCVAIGFKDLDLPTDRMKTILVETLSMDNVWAHFDELMVSMQTHAEKEADRILGQ